MAFKAWIKRAWKGAEGIHTVIWLYGFTGFAAATAYLASVTESINVYGPLAWAAIGISAFLVLSFSLYLYGRYQAESAISVFTRHKYETGSTNVLSAIHQDERIDLVDFYHPFYRPTENARFENCDLMGPAWIAVDGCNFLTDGFHDCEIVIVRTDRPIVGASLFRFCTFVRSHFYRVTFVVNIDQYKSFPAEFRTGVRVISDGRVGDV